MLLISVGFGLVGLLFVKYPVSIANSGLHHKPVFEVEFIGILSLFFSLLGCVVFVSQLVYKHPGLIINDNGINFYPGTFGSNFISWGDISKFDRKEVGPSTYVSIDIIDPPAFIDGKKNAWKRKVLSLAYKKKHTLTLDYGTDNLKCDFDELLTLLNTRLTAYKRAEKVTNFERA